MYCNHFFRVLVFTAGLLLSGFACAAAPSATLSVQIIHAAPGNAPAPPAQATAANFNTCVVCIDFTAASGGVFVNGAQVAAAIGSNPSTWLDCAGAGNPIWFHGSNGNTQNMPCPDIVNDGLGNPHVLRMLSGPQPATNVNGMKLYNNGAGTGIMAPTNNYMEATYIVTQFPQFGFSEGAWLGGAGEIPSGVHNFLEFDAFEVNNNLNAGAYASVGRTWLNGQDFIGSNWAGTFPPNYDSYNLSTQYLKIGQRITSDGSSLYKCMWINDVFQNCVHSIPNGSTFTTAQLGDATSRMQTYFILSGCLQCFTGTTSNMIAYAKNFYMWSCLNWQATACKTGAADPGGY